MNILVKTIDSYTNVKIWDITEDKAIVQLFTKDKKYKRATCKIKEYKHKRYITCKGRRYYIGDFTPYTI